jgi:CBS domain-containing protein
MIQEPNRKPGSSAGPAEATPIAEIMTTNVVSVTPDLGVETLTRLFLERDFSGAPVIDESGRAIGIVSKTDLLRESFERGDSSPEAAPPSLNRGGIEVPLGPGMHEHRGSGITARDVMTPLAFTLPESATIARASALMAHEGVHRVPVVDETGKVVGILSALDVLRWLAKNEGYVIPDRRPH